jgi:hypothetical protein
VKGDHLLHGLEEMACRGAQFTTGTMKSRFSRAFSADWGPTLHRAARIAAAAAVLVAVIAADLASLAYRAGYGLGVALHRLNDQLAARWVALIVTEAPTQPEPIAAPLALPPAAEPFGLLSPAKVVLMPPAMPPMLRVLTSLTVKQLRHEARQRGLSALARKGRKDQLIEALAA